ncbi:hypothetical protein [Massilia varians]|uniref:hypothetical protein n=1 Tax=Massilia varians TaxID=457921 RepID=UPI0025523560|nr:hypothetical protein [Massilia varians]MDK6079623.1 hypothetical protein [Massilia varians]
MKTPPATLLIGHYPQLALLAWSRKPTDVITGEEAFALYEANWRMVDQEKLGEAELELIEGLTQVYGGGVMNV